MSGASHEELKQILAVVETALEMHARWYEELIRTLLCKLPPPEKTVLEDAHRHCDFGKWFYSNNSSSFLQLPVFNKIEELHKSMHDSARDICLKRKTIGIVREQDFDVFVEKVSRFRNELESFRKRTVATLINAGKV